MAKESSFSPLLRQVLILGSVTLILIAVQPFLWGMVESNAQKVSDIRTSHEQLKILEERLTQAASVVATGQNQMDQVAALLPNQETPQLISLLENRADESQVSLVIRSIQQEAATDTGTNIQTVKVLVEASGLPEQLLRYIESLEYSPTLIQINEWSLTTSQNQLSAGNQTSPAPQPARLFMTITFFTRAVENN